MCENDTETLVSESVDLMIFCAPYFFELFNQTEIKLNRLSEIHSFLVSIISQPNWGQFQGPLEPLNIIVLSDTILRGA